MTYSVRVMVRRAPLVLITAYSVSGPPPSKRVVRRSPRPGFRRHLHPRPGWSAARSVAQEPEDDRQPMSAAGPHGRAVRRQLQRVADAISEEIAAALSSCPGGFSDTPVTG